MKQLLQKHSRHLWLSLFLFLVGATAVAIPKINGINDTSVAKIGSTEYATLQEAVTAAQQAGDSQTISLIGDVSGETVTIQEVANFKLTIDGKKDESSNYTVDATIVVDGLRGNGGSTTNGASVTLQNIAFVKTTATDGIQASHYPHNLTIQDCTYSGSDNDKWFLNASVDGPLYGVTVKNVTVEHARLIYANMAEDAVFQNITATNDVKVGFNVKTSGTAVIENCQVTTGKYAFRDYSDAYEGTFTLKGNTFISTSEASDEGVIVNRGGAVGTAHINVESGTYAGHLKVLNNKEGVLAISGGYFSEEFPQEYIAADLAAQGKVCASATDKEGYFTVGDPRYVAQIGETKYVSLQSALDAAHEMTGDVTVELLDDIEGYSIVHQKAGLNLTIDGAEKTLAGQIIIDGDGRASGTETLTIQDIKFEDDLSNFYTGTDAFILVPSTKDVDTPYTTGKYNYAHNITITDCSYNSTADAFKAVGFKSNSGAGCYNLVMSNVTGANLHSLAQLTGTTGATFDNCSATQTGSFIGVNGGTGTYTVSNCTFESHPDKADGYAYREKSNSTAVATLTNNNFKSFDAIILGSDGTINVESGTYEGKISKTAGTIAISGGYFSEEFPQEYIAADLVAQGKVCVPATDMEGYFTVGDPHYVAQIGETKYVSLQSALDAAHEMTGDVTITLLDNITEVALVHQKAGLNLTIDGDGKTLKGQIYIDGDGRLEGTDALTIKNIKFAYDASTYDDAFIYAPNTKTTGKVYTTGKYNYDHNVTITDCEFAGEGTTTVAVRVAAAAGGKNLTIANNTAVDGHSFAQITGVTNLTITNNNVTGVKNGINISGGGGTASITGNTLQADTAEGYTVRFKDGNSSTATLESNTLGGGEGIVNTATGGTTITINSGYYAGPLPTEEGRVLVNGGYFTIAPALAVCAEGLFPVGSDQENYPYTVGQAVAEVNGIYYSSFEAAVDARTSDDDVVTLLATTKQTYTYTFEQPTDYLLVVTKVTLGDGTTVTHTVNREKGPNIPDDSAEMVYKSSSATVGTATKYFLDIFEPVFEVTSTAGKVTYEKTVPSAYGTNGTYKLLKDAERATRSSLGTATNVTIDLNGHTLTYTSTDAVFAPSRTSTFNIIGEGRIIANNLNPTSGAIINVNYSGDLNYTIGQDVIIETNQSGLVLGEKIKGGTININGTVNAGDFVVTVNGSRTGADPCPTINIGSTAVLTSATPLYLAGYAITNVDEGATITGSSSGIEIRAGVLNVAGGEIKSTASGLSVAANASGTTTIGAAVAIAQHTTNLPINVTISGGSLEGASSLSIANPQENTEENVEVSVTDGTFTGEVKVTDDRVSKFLSGGYYSVNPEEEMIVDGKISIPATDKPGYWIIETGQYVAAIGDVKYASLEAAIEAATAGQTITLLANIDATAQVEVGKQVTLDLNGKTIEYKGTTTLTSGVLMVLRGGDLTITDSSEGAAGAIKSGTNAYAAIALTKAGETSTETAKLTVENGLLEGDYYGITGNGSRHGTEITINGGVIKGTHENDNLGIYHPQDGTLTINGGTISGYSSAVELRAGTLNVTGGTLNATAETYSYANSGSGNTTVGAAVAIAPHNTGKSITTNITGATLSGTKLISVVDTQNNDLSNVTVTASDDYIDNTVIPTAFKWVSNGDGTSTLTPCEYVAQIGDVKYETLEAAIADATAGETITLLANIDATAQVEVGKQVTLDLNGKTIEYKGTTTLTSGVLMVLRGGDLTITDSSEGAAGAIKSGTNAYAAIALTKAGETSTETAKLTVDDGLIEGYYYAITGNGSRHGTEITINGGVIQGVCEGDNVGIFHPQDGTLTITGGTISGASGVEVRSGTLNVTGGTITSTATEYSVISNGSGTTTVGAAIAIAQHTTGRPINANITGGTLSGLKTISVADPEGKDLEGVVVTVKDELTEGNVVIPDGYIWLSNNDGTSTLTKIEDGEYKLIDGIDYPFMNLKSDISVPEVTYQRSFSSTQNGKYQTWYVPMDYTITEEDAANFTFYKIHMIAGADAPGEADEDAIFLYVTAMNVGETLKGNRPYIIKPGDVFTDYIFAAEDTKLYAPTSVSRLNVTTSTRSYDFYGKYERESYSGSVGDFFFLSGGSLHPNNSVTTNLPYRWIIKVTGNSTNDDYSKISFDIVEDGTTGINPSRIINSDEVEGIYTINGMKLDEPVRGINIIRYKNGKTEKIIVK